MKELKSRAILVAAVTVALLTSGCTTGPGPGNTTVRPADLPLLGTWQLASFLGANGETVQPVASSIPLVTFDRSGRVGGSVGCNHFTAGYTVSGSGLVIGPAVSTLMYCSEPPGVMDQEQRVFELLSLTAGFTVTGDTLVLLDRAGNRVMTFQRASVATDASLAGPKWRLAGFRDNETTRSALPGPDAALVFSPDGRLSGTTGCNTVSGTYSTNGNAISIGPLAVTERACLDPAPTAQERDLLAALGAAASYTIQGDRLALSDGAGSRTVEFVRTS
jgi:heat shock protein HslJ